MSKTWFITGAGRGFGREFTLAALGRGDRVAATAREVSALGDLVERFGDQLLPLQLDVTDRPAVFAAVEQAASHFGRLDVVVNNAGYGLFGAVEEISEEQLRHQLEVNLFGVFHVVQAVLPVLRRQGSGHIVQISTVGGVVTFPSLGGYHASKWALEGLTETLSQEVAPFGISVTLVEPGGFETDWAGSSAVHAQPRPEYQFLRDGLDEQRRNLTPQMIGDPAAVGPALLEVVDADQPPLRIFFGLMPTQLVPGVYRARLETWTQWEKTSIAANGR